MCGKKFGMKCFLRKCYQPIYGHLWNLTRFFDLPLAHRVMASYVSLVTFRYYRCTYSSDIPKKSHPHFLQIFPFPGNLPPSYLQNSTYSLLLSTFLSVTFHRPHDEIPPPQR